MLFLNLLIACLPACDGRRREESRCQVRSILFDIVKVPSPTRDVFCRDTGKAHGLAQGSVYTEQFIAQLTNKGTNR